MNLPTKHEYLAAEVLSAPPQKLQLMLVEAALRKTRQAAELWQRDETAAGEAIIKAQEIVAQLLGGLSADRGSELVRRAAGVYTFVFRSLVAGHLRREPAALQAAINVLEIERETWQQVCRQLGTAKAPHFVRGGGDVSGSDEGGFSAEG